MLLDIEPIKNIKLSWKAKGLLTYFMSLPDTWIIHMSEIAAHATDGLCSFWSGIKELKDAGYMVHHTLRNKQNKIIKHIYLIRENPHLDFLHIENLYIENLHIGNRTLLYKDSNKYGNKRNTYSRQAETPSKFDKDSSKDLQQIILSQKNIKLNTLNWPNTFRKLRTINKVSEARITKVMEWYEENIGDDYTPVVYSAKSFRDKFSRLEDAIKRKTSNNKKNKNSADSVTVTKKYIGKNKKGEKQYETICEDHSEDE